MTTQGRVENGVCILPSADSASIKLIDDRTRQVTHLLKKYAADVTAYVRNPQRLLLT
jgi:hypothetical protein